MNSTDNLVNIPVLQRSATGGRFRLSKPEPWMSPARSPKGHIGKSVCQYQWTMGKPQGDNLPKPGSREKPLSITAMYPYRKPTQVGGCECTKARERTFAKELCNLAP